jgi:hypothetical protein
MWYLIAMVGGIAIGIVASWLWGLTVDAPGGPGAPGGPVQAQRRDERK